MCTTVKSYLMKCGHTTNSEKSDGSPCCAICFGITQNAEIVVEEPDLTGRISRCSDCGSETPSKVSLPFFKHKPDSSRDDYYDGCRGWD